MKIIGFNDFTVTYNDSEETQEKVFCKLLDWYIKHKQFTGEGIMQSDNCNIDAIDLLVEIADDIIAFKEKWKDLPIQE